MGAVRMSAKEARRLGVKVPRQPFEGVRLRSLDGFPRMQERDLQRQIVAHYRRALRPPASVVAVPNQRPLGHLSPEAQGKALRALGADGMVAGASDTLFEWDVANGAPGNAGSCWIELKRPVDPKPVSREQLDFILAERAMGRVAGWAQCAEQVEQLLEEAGAPLMIRVPRRDVPPWWDALGALPPLRATGGVGRIPTNEWGPDRSQRSEPR